MRTLSFVIISIALFSSSVYASLMPNGGEHIPIGQYYSVSWSESDFAKHDKVIILLWLQDKSRWEQLTECDAQQKSFRWLVTHSAGNNYRIKIQSKQNPSRYLLSEAYFSIIIPAVRNIEGQFITEDKVRVSPNPVDGVGTCSWEGDRGISLRIIAQNGNVVHSGLLSGTNSCTVDVKSLIQGLYIVEIVTEKKEILTGKLYIIR